MERSRNVVPDESKRLMTGALVLAAAGLFIKVLSALYRVPFQNIVGDTGFYIYQQVYPFYGIAAVLATSGFPVVVSRIAVAKQMEKSGYSRFAQAAFLTIALVGGSLFLCLFFGAKWIALWMGDPLLKPVLQMVAVPYLFLPFYSVWRGIFQGEGYMVPTALSQVTEQLVRVVVILGVSIVLVRQGASLYDVGRGAWSGSVIGGLMGLVLLGYYAFKKRRFTSSIKGLSIRELFQTGKLVLLNGTAICVSGLLLILFQLIDSLNLYSLLIQAGTSVSEAKVLKGIFDRGQPLIQLGTVVATALSLALVPAVTSAWAQGSKKMLHKQVQAPIKISFVFGAGAAAGLINIMKPTNIMLFKNSDGSAALAVLAGAIFFMAVIITFSSIMQGMGHVYAPAKYILVGVVCKYLANVWLVPSYGTLGASIATIIGLCIVSVLLTVRLNKHIPIMGLIRLSVIKLLPAIIVMTIILQGWQYCFQWAQLTGRLWNSVSAVGGVIIGGGTYILAIFRSKLFSDEEIQIIPLTKKIRTLFNLDTERRRTH